MQDIRFKPPEAALRDQPLTPGSAVKGIVIGVVVDIAGTILSSIVIGIIYTVLWSRSGMTGEQIKAAAVDTPFFSWLFLTGALGGAAFSVLGGYVCERIARRGSYRVGLIMGFITVGIGLALGNEGTSLLQLSGLSLLTLASILLGTRLGWQRQ